MTTPGQVFRTFSIVSGGMGAFCFGRRKPGETRRISTASRPATLSHSPQPMHRPGAADGLEVARAPDHLPLELLEGEPRSIVVLDTEAVKAGHDIAL